MLQLKACRWVSKTLSGAADEGKKRQTALYAESFDKGGVSVTLIQREEKDQETSFAEVFSALADMENQTERTAIANKPSWTCY